MTVDLYYVPQSPPCRGVMLAAEAIGLPLNLIYLDIMKGENLTPEFEQMNPAKTIPFIVDEDLKLSESRAIMCYLADQYAKDDKFYPKAAKERAIVDERLYFDLALCKNVLDYYIPVLFGKRDTYDELIYNKLVQAFEIFNAFLEGTEYSTGRNITIADLTLIATITTAEVFGFDLSPYKNVTRWMEKVKNSAPGYKQINEKGLDILRQLQEQKNSQQNEESVPEENEQDPNNE